MATVNNTLTFVTTQSVSRFKAINGISKLSVKLNPETGKHFFVCPDDSKLSGKVSTGIDLEKELSISECVSTVDGTTFYMMHNTGDSSANTVKEL